MNTKQITGEAPFQILAHSFSVSPSESGFTLSYSADGRSYTNWDESTPANETLVVNGIAKGMFFKLSGNSSTVSIIW